MTDLHERIERLIAHLEEENRTLQRLLRKGHSLDQADRALQALQAEPGKPPMQRPGERPAGREE